MRAECGLAGSKDIPNKDVLWMEDYDATKPVCTNASAINEL